MSAFAPITFREVFKHSHPLVKVIYVTNPVIALNAIIMVRAGNVLAKHIDCVNDFWTIR